MEKGTQKIGLVLSGGGVRGLAHVGLIKALNEHGIEADCVSGTSAGALVGALYANNYGPEDMIAFFKEAPLFHYNYFTINKPGFIDTERYVGLLKEYFPGDNFSELDRKLYVVATDLQNGEEKVFDSGQLIRPLLASAALTPVFSPVMIQNRWYADGGILNNFPKEYLNTECDYIIGSNVATMSPVQPRDLKNPLQVTARVSSLTIYGGGRRKMKECNVLVEPMELEHIGVLDKRRIERAYEIGYEEATRVLEKKELENPRLNAG